MVWVFQYLYLYYEELHLFANTFQILQCDQIVGFPCDIICYIETGSAPDEGYSDNTNKGDLDIDIYHYQIVLSELTTSWALG